jgi:energy-coupling factor transporter ATP-binding protein EcfA2
VKSIQFQDFSFRYLHRKDNALHDLNFSLDEGQVVGVLGPAGAGKSTMVKALNGLVPKVDIGYQEGDVVVSGQNTREKQVSEMARHVGVVLQNPEVQIFALKVIDDIAFGPANLGVPREEINRRVERALISAELTEMANRNPNDLSGGEQQSLAIAGLLAMEPRIMAFDEPISMLDPLGKERVMNVTTESGADIEAVADVVDHVVVLQDGTLIMEGEPHVVLADSIMDDIKVGRPQVSDLALQLGEAGFEFDQFPITLDEADAAIRAALHHEGVTELERPPSFSTEVQTSFGENVLEVENLHHIYDKRVHALRGVSLEIPSGQIVGVIGQNGSGKTTLARHLVGLLKPTNKSDASIRVKGQDITKLRMDKIITMINYVFQNPDDQLFAERIWDEVAFASEVRDLDKDEVKRLTEDALEVFGLSDYRNRYVYGLDEDLKTYLAITCVLPLGPDILLIDEPTTGLDTKGEILMMESLRRLRDEQGKTIIIITHNMKTVGNHCDRVLVMSKGNILLDGTPREVFQQEARLLDADIRPPQITRLGQRLAAEFGCPRDVLTVEEMTQIMTHSLQKSREMSR